jgi:clathrin heavy chain
MESDKFITVCETSQQQVAFIDLSAGNSVSRQKMSAEAAIMNPVSKVIALRGEYIFFVIFYAQRHFPRFSYFPSLAGQTLQVFNLESRAKMKSYNSPAPVTYWRWITPNTIALVTASSVFHWSIEGDAAPIKVFDRNPAVGEGTQILNYSVSSDSKWCLLCGISAGATPGVVNGNLQLYSIEKQVSQMLQGHTGTFTTLKIPGREDGQPAQILVFEEKKPDSSAKLFIMEVGRDKTAPGGIFRVTPQAIPVPDDATYDFPVTMNCSKTNGLFIWYQKWDIFIYLIFFQENLFIMQELQRIQFLLQLNILHQVVCYVLPEKDKFFMLALMKIL